MYIGLFRVQYFINNVLLTFIVQGVPTTSVRLLLDDKSNEDVDEESIDTDNNDDDVDEDESVTYNIPSSMEQELEGLRTSIESSFCTLSHIVSIIVCCV